MEFLFKFFCTLIFIGGFFAFLCMLLLLDYVGYSIPKAIAKYVTDLFTGKNTFGYIVSVVIFVLSIPGITLLSIIGIIIRLFTGLLKLLGLKIEDE